MNLDLLFVIDDAERLLEIGLLVNLLRASRADELFATLTRS